MVEDNADRSDCNRELLWGPLARKSVRIARQKVGPGRLCLHTSRANISTSAPKSRVIIAILKIAAVYLHFPPNNIWKSMRSSPWENKGSIGIRLYSVTYSKAFRWVSAFLNDSVKTVKRRDSKDAAEKFSFAQLLIHLKSSHAYMCEFNPPI